MEVSPINPADLSFMKGYYSSAKKLPVTIGSEGAGLVVEAGSDPYARSLIGRKVAILVEKG
jgi:NADPH:quinone reductase-like Zn-dependent oxidoreductase